jgi:RNA polymerase sigma-70 factor (ECF subfamily)
MADPAELIAVYLRKRRDLVRFFTKRTGSPAAAEDIVQEIYLKIGAGGAVEEVRRPEAYLYRVGSNVMLDRLKGEGREAAREQAWRRLWAGDGREGVADAPSAEDVLASRQRLQRLLDGIEELPPQVATAFRRHKLDGLTHGEVAAELGVSRSAVEKYIMAALRHLMTKVEPWDS